MDLFYHKGLEIDKKSLQFVGDEYHHIVKVMRYKVGDKFFITNGKGLIAEATLHHISKNECECEINSLKSYNLPKKKIIALIPVLKHLERFEFALEKLTEIGVSEIVPYFSERTVRKNFRFDRSEKILISAIKQSFNPFLPKLSELISFDKYLDKLEQKSLIVYGTPEEKNLIDVLNEIDLNQIEKFIITVGPEGDYTTKEFELLKSKNAVGVNLGSNRLRSETAIVCLLAQLKLFLRDY